MFNKLENEPPLMESESRAEESKLWKSKKYKRK